MSGELVWFLSDDDTLATKGVNDFPARKVKDEPILGNDKLIYDMVRKMPSVTFGDYEEMI